MKWFDRWFYSKVRWTDIRGGYDYPDLKKTEDMLDSAAEMHYSDDDSMTCGNQLIEVTDDPHNLYDGMKIDIKRVTGGNIVTVRHPYKNDSINVNYDEHPRKCSYIVKDDESFDSALSRIITMELLKQ
jgi:hypothetical protein